LLNQDFNRYKRYLQQARSVRLMAFSVGEGRDGAG
jgi:hypothetical protein